MVSLPYGGILIHGGADTIALSTTAVQLDSFSEAGGANSNADANSIDGDPAVIPDKTNNRIKVQAPGIYEVEFVLTCKVDSAVQCIARLRKNGTAYGNGVLGKCHVLTTMSQIVFKGIVVVSASDATGTLPTFGDPSGTFTGGSGAPKTLAYLDVTLESSTGTPTITNDTCTFMVKRVG
jgi:hypothetical protein